MADLRSLFESCGFHAVQTYIQSGNVLFESDRDEQSLIGTISEAFGGRFGFQSPVVLRSEKELSGILESLPFTETEIARAEAAEPEVAHVYVFLSDKAVDPGAAAALQAHYGTDDKLFAGKREFYLLCRGSIRDSKPAAALSKPEAALTARNLNTICKIHEALLSEHA